MGDSLSLFMAAHKYRMAGPLESTKRPWPPAGPPPPPPSEPSSPSVLSQGPQSDPQPLKLPLWHPDVKAAKAAARKAAARKKLIEEDEDERLGREYDERQKADSARAEAAWEAGRAEREADYQAKEARKAAAMANILNYLGPNYTKQIKAAQDASPIIEDDIDLDYVAGQNRQYRLMSEIERKVAKLRGRVL